MFETLLGLALALQPETLAKQCTNNGRYEESIQLLQTMKPRAGEYAYLMAVNHFQLNHKAETERWIKDAQVRFQDDGPPRQMKLFDGTADTTPTHTTSSNQLSVSHQALINLMAADLQQWRLVDEKDPKKPDVGNVARKMKVVTNRLENAKAGPQTQAVQREVKKDLDDLVKALEDDLKKQQEQQAGGGQGKGKPQQGGQQQGQPQQGPSPQQDSMGGMNGGPGKVDQKKLMNLQQNWGKLPEKDRAKAMMELTKDLPPRYREVIENYFKTLARTQEDKK